MKKYIFIIILLFTISYLPCAAIAQIHLETGLPNIPNNDLPAENALPSYISYLFVFGLGLVTILALTQMIIGGIMYILAAGNAAKVEDAKDTIYQALFGLGILLVSYLLLHTINPNLVSLQNPNLPSLPPVTCGVGDCANSYQWTNVPPNKYCADVLGPGWRDVDPAGHCQSQRPENSTCCAYFPSQ